MPNRPKFHTVQIAPPATVPTTPAERGYLTRDELWWDTPAAQAAERDRRTAQAAVTAPSTNRYRTVHGRMVRACAVCGRPADVVTSTRRRARFVYWARWVEDPGPYPWGPKRRCVIRTTDVWGVCATCEKSYPVTNTMVNAEASDVRMWRDQSWGNPNKADARPSVRRARANVGDSVYTAGQKFRLADRLAGQYRHRSTDGDLT